MSIRIVAIITFLTAMAFGSVSGRADSPADMRVTGEEPTAGGWLGISIQDMTPRLARSMQVKAEQGALVSEVMKGSPAGKAGVSEEDIVVEFDGQDIGDADGLRAAVRHTAPGAEVAVVVVRRDERKSLRVKIGKTPRTMAAPFPPVPPISPRVFRFETSAAMGLTLRTLNGQMAKYFQVPGGRGVLVEEVEEESEGAKAGFQAGDVITSIGEEPVEQVRDVRRALRNADEAERVSLEILRRGAAQRLTLTVEEQEQIGGHRFHWRSGPDTWWFDGFDGPDLEDLHLDMENLRPHLDRLREKLKHLNTKEWSSIRPGGYPGLLSGRKQS
jgi:S1-C subfamily serine protease